MVQGQQMLKLNLQRYFFYIFYRVPQVVYSKTADKNIPSWCPCVGVNGKIENRVEGVIPRRSLVRAR